MRVRVLVTNDDGIDSPGLHALAAVAVREGAEVTVAAPAHDASGSSAALTAHVRDGAVSSERVDLPDLPGVPAYSVGAQPAFIVFSALQGAFGDPPELVLSGINRGPNVGRAVLHSGTVGAALTAGLGGVSGIAVSLDSSVEDESAGVDEPHWETAADVVPIALRHLLAECAAGTVFNLNVPNDVGPCDTLHRARLGHFGAVQTRVERAGDSDLRMTTMVGEPDFAPGTDAAHLAAGRATITALRGITESGEVGLPASIALPAR
ncbi:MULTISPECIES: 5'/3'-nucleotidase SurE [Actinoalloteichus]|uniref:5'-nucleotidase n=1 Tax=Actinoalloteichus caeruleus DSM 43889 TaxID=1120930 RepID=A0ABT1JN57_ACTCY|nr:5'/3'-nucleotidase SurE [Actinoalloteichus caeruleus]MCP2333965.1 5'-nucleotidase [Actinoalloteichus caeruleus DSM 43889]